MNRNLKILSFKKKELANFYLNNNIKYLFFGVPEKPYTYNIKDSILLKSSATNEGRKQQKNPGFKRSLGKFSFKIFFKTLFYIVGYDEGRDGKSTDKKKQVKEIRRIKARKWVTTGRRGKKVEVIEVYKVTGSDEWFTKNDIAPRFYEN